MFFGFRYNKSYKNVHKKLALLFSGSYFCYDGPGALQDEFETDLELSVAQFSYLYAWYSWPNTILCFFGGYLIDRVFGIRLGAIIFGSFILLGQLVFAFGTFSDLFWMMCLGRFMLVKLLFKLSFFKNFLSVLESVASHWQLLKMHTP